MKKDSKELLKLLFRLSTLFKIQKDIGTWYENGYFTSDHGELIREGIKDCLTKMHRFTVAIADSVQPVDDIFDVMIAPADGDLYGNITKQLYNSPGVFSRFSHWQEIVNKPKL
jgi:hypothetical protein